jgi:hypothetical protein
LLPASAIAAVACVRFCAPPVNLHARRWNRGTIG